MTRKTTIASMLLLCALAAAAVSCGSGDGTTISTDTAPTSGDAAETAAETTVSTDDRPALNLPEKDFNGESLRILGYETGVDCIKQYDFYYDEASAGELVNDAIHKRNMLIEERYNCVIEVTNDKTPKVTARNSITAGSDDFDIMELYINDAMSMAMEGMFLNWYDLDYISMDESWWDQAIQRDLAIYDRIYVMTGDISVYDEELNYCVYFNKQVATNNDIPDVYEMARNKTWTMDVMYELGKSVAKDLNGDGVRDENDQFGLLSDSGMMFLFYFTCGNNFVTLDENGEPYFTVESERTFDVCDSLVEFFSDTDTMLWASKCSNTWTTLDKVFMENRNLFRPGSIYDIVYYRNMEHDFGILPYPLFDEQQEDYYHLIATHVCPGICVPTTNAKLDMTSYLLEALAYESRDTVTEAYYDLNLYTKMARDDESGDMLDIIFSTKRYDLGFVFDWGSLRSSLETLVTSGKSFSTVWESKEKSAQKAMEETMEFYRSNDN
ncbi:MAG: hypothetical protein IJ449_02220 [Clostridia bacterium]|nr:hypothetical protein [Clostridia bacterium]